MLVKRKKISFLGSQPTLINYLPTLSKELGVELFIKRDDLTLFGAGGNKLRKLEYILYDAIQKGATTLLTVGGAQTNHGRLTAAVAAKYGMKCVIVCVDEYPGEISASILLDGIFNAEVVMKKNDGRDSNVQLAETVAAAKARYEDMGETVYEIPLGGSDVVGIMGYYECAVEITAQAQKLGIEDATVATGVGSMGTYLGLYCGLKNEGSPLGLTGIAILPFTDYHDRRIVEYFRQVKKEYNLSINACREDFNIETGYTRGAYNNPDSTVRQAIYSMARAEAILLDPCYTGKVFAGVLDMIEEGKIKKGERIILLHTGGLPGLYTKHHRVEFEKELIGHVTIVD
ncbi:1-aminocyclopropane-1-carboxylate deaminase/D-cysteine desulfhydrase [Clostridium sp. WILCCON 0269]|uniref:1-aminocyclopropane-1-carboxylate deaminase/D-cysteine desulfhydrase n=1 Tax=Candidatus Clostridium eludens TaxID=3381663 RepID=A0ABW8SKM2_9CLOT